VAAVRRRRRKPSVKRRKAVIKKAPAAAASKTPVPAASVPRKLRIFVGSSSASRSQAKRFIDTFKSPNLIFIPWWEAFTAGNTLLEELDAVRRRVDGALLLFSPESKTTIRNHRRDIPNLNVLFELGYFYGHLGKKNVAMLKYGDFYLPSDLDGYIHIFGSKSFRRSQSAKIGKRTTDEFQRWLSKL
jgi:predicted nucleotide-binding protein